MKSLHPLFLTLILLILAGCGKESHIEPPIEVNKVRPHSIKIPNGSNYNVVIPDVPKFDGVIPSEEEEENMAEVRGETFKVDPGNNHLQAIINEADWGDKIVLREGTHHVDETLVINRRIKLEGEDGAVLSLGGELGLYIIDARKTRIKDLKIVGTANSVFGIAVEGTKRFKMEDNHMSGFLISVLIEDSWKVEIKDNVIIGVNNDFVTGGIGITIINGNRAEVYGNDVSVNSFGMWLTDKDGKAKDNVLHGNGMGIILCNVPPGSFSDVFTTGTGGSENPATRWKVEDNMAYNNIWGYIVIDGATDNELKGNEGHNNSFVDLELAGPTTELFGELVPGSWDNEVDAGDLYYIDCGEDNEVENGHLADVDCGATHSSADVLEMGFITVPGSSSILHRTGNGITVNFNTKNLIPGNAYTLWFVVFGDAPGPPSSTFADGLVVGDNGNGDFSAHLSIGDIFDTPNVITIFNNPLTAEVHMALRTHGPVQPGMMPDQIETIDGGCVTGFPSGPTLYPDSDVVGYCANIQVAMHPGN